MLSRAPHRLEDDPHAPTARLRAELCSTCQSKRPSARHLRVTPGGEGHRQGHTLTCSQRSTCCQEGRPDDSRVEVTAPRHASPAGHDSRHQGRSCEAPHPGWRRACRPDGVGAMNPHHGRCAPFQLAPKVLLTPTASAGCHPRAGAPMHVRKPSPVRQGVARTTTLVLLPSTSAPPAEQPMAW